MAMSDEPTGQDERTVTTTSCDVQVEALSAEDYRTRRFNYGELVMFGSALYVGDESGTLQLVKNW